MSIKPEDFHDSEIGKHSSDIEVERRNAVSRTYYSMYHYTIQAGYQGRYVDTGMHQSLIDELLNDKETKGAGWMLSAAKKLRVTADYRLNENLTKSEAETIISLLEHYPEKLPQLHE